MKRKAYSAGTVKMSFWFMEFRKVVGILAEGKSLDEIKKINQNENIFAAPTTLRSKQILNFGYIDAKPTLESFVLTLFVSYTAKQISSKLPKDWQPFVSYRSGNVIAFMDSMKNNILYRDKYDEFSDLAAAKLEAISVFEDYLPEELLNCDTFICVDRILIKWIVERLLAEDIGAKLDGKAIPDIAKMREKRHFGKRTGREYRLLGSAYHIVSSTAYKSPDGLTSILAQYIESDYKIDREYRKFYYEFDQLKEMHSFPISTNVFKLAGGGQNFVHGGSSPQEMLVPVLDIKMERGHMDTKNAQIALVSMIQKITNKITVLDFIQSEPVSDIVKAATYKIFFISEDNEKISDEASFFADSRESDTLNRIFRMKFRFKDKKYDKDKKYYLVVYDDSTGMESFRHPVIMDLTFIDDYGFGF